ncbi:hypothetical protein FisN_2Lh159 [Fistulifera solaris]|uniref:Uncharacterized protein n=1 Tax=Fistulifera solaris TaxID=1519565 RepID=A0A1Z5KFZ7_FISSO|nr:hypothetical protein FisN_2Lh159 [Fistulifera solaris]|eukprot:GAX24888.1 hypothetical protein FisN_2Lh159 [Fistulifera solaris]
MASFLSEAMESPRPNASGHRVTFNNTVKSCIVERITIILDRDEVWYSSQECQSMRRQCEQIANLVKAGGSFRESESNTTRGLEGMLAEDQLRRRFSVKYAVSEELYRQRLNDEYDPDGVAEASLEVSRESVEDAIRKAEGDAEAAAQWIEQVTQREEAEATATARRKSRGNSLISNVKSKSPFRRTKFIELSKAANPFRKMKIKVDE